MQNIETVYYQTNDSALDCLLLKARNEERKNRALAVSIRLDALAAYITQKGMSGTEAAELLRREAERYENESQELH